MTPLPQARTRPATSAASAARIRTAAALAAIVALAVALRVAFWAFQARSGAVQPGDPEEYYRAALHILQGGYYDTGKWIRPPLYPLFLALVFRLFGASVSAAMLVQAVLTGVGVLAFAAYARQRFGPTSAALLAALLAALYLPLASFGSVMFAEALFVLLMLPALMLIDRVISRESDEVRSKKAEVRRQKAGLLLTSYFLLLTSSKLALAAGALLGLATLTRAVGLFFVPLAALLVWWLTRDRPGAWQRAGALLLGAALVIGPWTARNALVHQRLIVVDTNGAVSMWYGTLRDEAEQQAGEAMLFAIPNQADRQSAALRLTLENIGRDPLGFAARARFKIASLFILQTRNYTAGSIIGLSPQGEQVALVEAEYPLRIALLADAQYILIMLLAIVGLCYARDWRRTLPLLVFVGLSVLLSAVTIGHPRLRLPIVGVLIPYAAFALVRAPALLLPRVGPRRPRRLALLAVMGCLAFLALIVSTRYIPWLDSMRYVIQARAAQSQDDPSGARRLLERARSADPDNALRTLDVADLAFGVGAYPEALERYREAAGQEPRSVYTHAMRIQAAQRLGRPEEARDALATIASYDRDTNDLYEWAWVAFTSPPSARLTPGDPLALGHFAGFAPASFDLPAGRWTLGEARLRLSGACEAVELRLRGPAGRTVQVGTEPALGEASLPLDGGEQLLRLPLAARPNCASAPLTLRITSPTGLLDLERAPWVVGVAVIGAEAR
ncbi:MAG TPA: glycosyltransferase family 39 protein [Roseiflexaceae bacterium]|nr:glycosyltransferase family 39 protein [Roseiflexaceae bacterium]